MTVIEEKQFIPDWFSKPGDALLSLMRRRNVSAIELANALEGGMDVLRGLLTGSIAVDGKRAKELVHALGGTEAFWLKRQTGYEEALERAVRVPSETEAEDLLAQIPSAGAKPQGRLTEASKREELRRRFAFFNVNNLHTWLLRYGYLRSGTDFRTSPTLLSDQRAVAKWLRQGEIEASLVDVKPWNPALLGQKIPEIRALCKLSKPDRFLPRLKEIFADAGVALVVVRAPKGCRASGAVRLIGPNKAMILLSFRFRADDQFWFTVFHELGHLILHPRQTFIDDEETIEDDREREANEFARGCIIPKEQEPLFARLVPSRFEIIRFSVLLGIAPGLAVGQLQHRGRIEHSHLNSLKRHWTWEQIEDALANL